MEPQLIKAEQLLQRIEQEPENNRNLLAKLCVLGSFIKRRGNLLLLGEEASRIHAVELEYCVRESLENLHLGGTLTSLSSSCSGTLPPDHVIAAYDFCQAIIERLLDHMTAMMVNLTCKNGKIRLNLQIGCTETVTQQQLSGIPLSCGTVSCEIMDEDVVIDLTIAEGGADEA